MSARPFGRGRWRAAWARPLDGWLLAAALVLLAGCNLEVAGVGGEGTGTFAAGRIDGFGSVVIGGETYDDRQAQLVYEVDPRAPQSLPITALRLGMVVRAEGSASRLATIRVAPELRAPIADLDLANRRFTAAGQTVQIDASPSEPTWLEGWRDLTDLREGGHVEVYGERGADGVIRASLIVRQPAESGVRVVGEVQRHPQKPGIWTIDALEIIPTRATVLPANRAIQVGDRIAAYSAAELTGSAEMVADVLEIQTAAPPAEQSVRIVGVVGSVHGLGRFELLGSRVDARAAVIEGGAASDLSTGRRVIVEGVQRDGAVQANRVRLLDPAQAPIARLAATIGNFVGPSGFDVRQNAVDARAAAFGGLSADNLANGVPVRVSGAWRGSAVAASSVETLPVADGDALAQAGRIESYDGPSGRFRLVGLDRPMRLQRDTLFSGGRPGDFANGVRVIVRGVIRDGELAVAEVRWPALDGAVELAGIAGGVEATPTGGEFELGEADVVWTPTTVFRGPTASAADLTDGRLVRVLAVRDGAVYRAVEVDARLTQSGAVRLRGTFTQVSGLAALRLDGQRVDASAAVFDPPSLRDALPGAYVDVEGRMVGGVLQATRVSDP